MWRCANSADVKDDNAVDARLDNSVDAKDAGAVDVYEEWGDDAKNRAKRAARHISATTWPRGAKSRAKRAARHIYATTWPRGAIPYQFEWGMEPWQKHMVRRVMTIWETNTCVQFREWPMAYNRWDDPLGNQNMRTIPRVNHGL